jgi:hypothetical protein
MITSRRCLIAIPAAIVLLGACEPVTPPPPGYEKNCYGGNYNKTYVNSRTFVTFLVHAPESDWPALAELLTGFGRAQQVQVFDTSLIQPNVHIFGISLCHAEGLFIYASKQNWLENKPYDPRPDMVNIMASAYANHDRWRTLAVALAEQLEQGWSGEVAVSWQPESAAAQQSGAK